MARIQHGPYNAAGDGDRIDAQVGRFGPADDPDQPTPPAAPGGSENIRTGSATVGEQVDVYVGDIRI
ncbi:hypothetical protein [Plantactinospora sp. WMMB782]|uniref:hypothetical protein n=1 Tax=Plantactinospora sp. WMMB782 TaxID=3404121 RepID=UPI003B957BD5